VPDNVGWVEYRDETGWAPVINLWPLVAVPDPDVWSCLFLYSGEEFINFQPLAEERGFPADASRAVRSAFEEDAGGSSPNSLRATWVTLDEIHHMDWDELSPGYDDDPYRYRREADGRLVLEAHDHTQINQPFGEHPVEWESDGFVYRFEHRTRRQLIERSPHWQTLLRMMEVLGAAFGAENVRIVIWFT